MRTLRLWCCAVPITALLWMTACCPCRHLSASQTDSVRVETIVRTEYVPDTVYVNVPVESERQTVRDTMSHLETSFAVSDARINADGSLFHSLANKAQVRPVPVEKEIVYRDSVVYRDRLNTEIVEVERDLTWWQQTQIIGFWALLGLAAIVARKQILAVLRTLIGVPGQPK